MSAKSKWWYCGACGFANHPRDPRQHGGDQEINDKCEQCGASREHDDAVDRDAGTGVR